MLMIPLQMHMNWQNKIVATGAGVAAAFILCAPVFAASTDAIVSVRIVSGTTIATISNLTVAPANLTGSSRNFGVFPQSVARTPGAQNLESGSPAVITIAGQPNQVVAISLPSEGVLLPNSTSMQISDFALNSGLTPSISASGTSRFTVSAKVSDQQFDGLENFITDADGPLPNERDDGDYREFAALAAPYFDIVVSYN